MRRTVAYAAGWLAAGVVAVVFGSVSVSMLSNRVTGSRPAPLNADEVRQQLIDADATTTTTLPELTTTTTAPSAPPPTSTTVPPPPRSRPPAPVTTTTAAAPQPAPTELRTYTLVGGTVTLRFSASGVTVEVATPNPGFAVDVEPTHGDGVRVELESEHHHSQVEGWWDDGPHDEVQEDGD